MEIALILFILFLVMGIFVVINMMGREIKLARIERDYWYNRANYYMDLYYGLTQKGLEDAENSGSEDTF